jgi:ATP-dependent exoDNAse (exonuclease V) beta subunit
MNSELHNVLKLLHPHERDENIKFYETGHKYEIVTDPKSKYTSVTTWNHSHFPHFNADEIIRNMMKGKSWKEGHKYWGLTPEQIKDMWNKNRDNAAGAGTNIHYEIECFMNNPNIQPEYTHKILYDNYFSQNITTNDSLEWHYFLQFLKDTPNLKPYRTEWMIYHEELKLAGSIDMVYENEDDTLSIYDWKRSANITKINTWNKFALTKCICHLPDSNFWHYALQLNTYRAIIQEKYGKQVTKLCLVRLHPDCEDETYEILIVPILEKEITDLFEQRKKEIYLENA